MTDPRSVTTRQVRLLAAADDGRLVDRSTTRGWATWHIDAVTGRATRIPRRRPRRLVAGGLLEAAPGHGHVDRRWRLTAAGHAVLHARRGGDLRRWWVTGTDRPGDLAVTAAWSPSRAVARHRRADPPAAAAVGLVDGPLTTGEMLDRAWHHDLGWAAAWAVAHLRSGTVPTAPLTQPEAAAVLPAAVFDPLAAQVTARRHTLHGHTAAGFAPPDVAPSSRHSWHAWLGTAAAATAEVAAPAASAPMPAGLTPVLDAAPPRDTATPATAGGRAFPPPRPTRAGPAALAPTDPFPPPPAQPWHTRHGPRH